MAPGRALLPAALLALALSPGPAAAVPCIADCPAGTFVASADCASCLPCPAGTFSSAAGRGDCRMCRKCEGTGGDATSPAVTSRGNDAAPARGRRGTGQITLRAYAKATSPIVVRAKVRAFAAPRCACCNLRLVFSLAGIFQYLKVCSSTSDAECTCKKGYRCGGDGCTYCTRSCGVGQESTGNGCQTCRYGTFNDQPNGSCKNWTKCSGNQVLEPGTPAKDVICKHASVNPTLVTTLPTTSLEIPVSITVPGNDVQTDMIRISLAVAGLSCIVFLLPLCICFTVWQKKKLHTVFKKMHTPEQSIQEDDACSCHFPEEEQGEYQDRGKSTEFRDLLVN